MVIACGDAVVELPRVVLFVLFDELPQVANAYQFFNLIL